MDYGYLPLTREITDPAEIFPPAPEPTYPPLQLTAKAREILQRVLEIVLSSPEHVNMSNWVTKSTCGTVACIAGWALVFLGKTPRDGYGYSTTAPQEFFSLLFPEVKERYLHISKFSSPTALVNLFERVNSVMYTGYWPIHLARQISTTTPGTEEYSRVVAARLYLLLEKGI